MSNIKSLYIEGLENHLELHQANKELITIGNELLVEEVTGNEGLLTAVSTSGVLDVGLSGLKSLASGLFSISKWTGGMAIKGLGKSIGGVGGALTKVFSDNQTLIRKMLSGISRLDEYSLKLKDKQLKVLTSSGDVEDVTKGIDDLLSFLEDFDKHSKDVISFLDKKLLIARKLSKARSSNDILKVTEESSNLDYPDMKEHKDLPGGMEVNLELKDKVTYIMRNNGVSATPSDLTLSKSEVNTFLAKLNKVNSYHVKSKANYDVYLKHLKNWGDMVKSTSNNLGELEGVSGSIMSEAETLLEGDRNGLLFYSGFTPRVVSYTDKYIKTVLGVFA